MLRFCVLGPMEIELGGTRIAVKSVHQRVALAILVISSNETVSADRLRMAAWPGQATHRTNNIHVHIYQLRQLFHRLEGQQSPERLQTRPDGYRLNTLSGERDLDDFDKQLASAPNQLDLPAAAQLYRQALGLWRGQALADVVGHTAALTADAMCLEERRLGATGTLIDLELRLGRHADLIHELIALTSAHPMRESLCGQLMTALYRTGRRAEASAAYVGLQKLLAAELGLEPCLILRQLHHQILIEDQALDIDFVLPHARQ